MAVGTIKYWLFDSKVPKTSNFMPYFSLKSGWLLAGPWKFVCIFVLFSVFGDVSCAERISGVSSSSRTNHAITRSINLVSPRQHQIIYTFRVPYCPLSISPSCLISSPLPSFSLGDIGSQSAFTDLRRLSVARAIFAAASDIRATL